MAGEWQVVGAWPAAIAAWLGAIAAWTAERRRRRERLTDMARDYDRLRAGRRLFWTALRGAYSEFWKLHQYSPQELDHLIDAGGMPPDVLSRKGRSLRLWPAENKRRLGPDQRLLCEFAALVYPDRQGRKGDVMDHSIIRDPDFHEARGGLSNFWWRWVPSVPMRHLRDSYSSALRQLVILSWLEIALVQWTGDEGEGNGPLFRVAQDLSVATHHKETSPVPASRTV